MHAVRTFLAPSGTPTEIPEPPIARFLFADTRLAWLWLLVRLYCGWQWLEGGLEKWNAPGWTGPNGGAAIAGGEE